MLTGGEYIPKLRKQNCFFKTAFRKWREEMPQRIKGFAAKLNTQSSIPRTHMVEKEKNKKINPH